MARVESVNDIPASVVEITGLANPPVVVVDPALNNPVADWIDPANPPPAIIESDHLRKGEKSASTEPITNEPAMIETGTATVSNILSNQGIKYAIISNMVAMPNAISAGKVPIHSKPGDRFIYPKSEKMLRAKNGTKILNPTAALNPTPIITGRNKSVSKLFFNKKSYKRTKILFY